MRIPFVSAFASSSYRSSTRRFQSRSPAPRGGGAHADGGGHASGRGGFGGGGHSGTPAASHGTVPAPAFAPGLGKSGATPHGTGVSNVNTIPEGQPFAGRTYGGATRQDVYGSSFYGSGYPGVSGLGTANRGFPFGFWPIAWGATAGLAGAAYLHTDEYGLPSNSTRPGGLEGSAVFISNSSSTIIHVVSDWATVNALIPYIDNDCEHFLHVNSSRVPIPFNGNGTDPLPEEAVQYYRASSVVLTLDKYNNTAALTGDANATAVLLPANVEMDFVHCVNSSIGQNVLLFSSASAVSPPGVRGLLVFMYAIWCLLALL